MDRKSLTSTVGLVAIITLSSILITAPLNGAQQRGAKVDPHSQSTDKKTDAKPPTVIAPIDPAPYTGEETRKYNETYIATQRDIAEASKRSARYTYDLVWIGSGIGVLEILLLGFQALYTGRAAKAARQTLLVTNRPKLVVRPITVQGLQDRMIGERLYGGEAWITNVGVLPVTLLKFWADWMFEEILPLINPAHSALDTVTAPSEILPGHFGKRQLKDFDVPTDVYLRINNDVEFAKSGLAFQQRYWLYLFGYIKFRDEIGLRRTFFLYGYDVQTGQFIPIEHPSYNYEE